ncbi:MAG: S41 family peptidase [bacterium]|nr:S41 family peptidase [bacterium]
MDPEQNQTVETNTTTRAPRRGRWALMALAAILVVGGAFRIGYVAGNKGFVFQPSHFKVTNQNELPKDVDYSLLTKALNIISQKYIDRDNIDQEKVLYGAIQGAVSAAGDEYTEFFDPKTLENFKTELQGSFSGIGAEIGKKDNAIVIIAPLDDSPAQRAGVLAKDIIVKVNGESTAELTVDETVGKIRGPEGSEVTLTLFREGKPATFDLKITRQKISVKSVKLSYKAVNGKNIAVIELSRFGDDTKELFTAAVRDINSKNNVAGVVVDVRNNPGGYLDGSVELASEWVEKGKLIVKEEHSQKDAVLYNSFGYNGLSKYKTVIIMNGGSASAAEILAGALRDNNEAILIGEKSFGKGSVQELVPLTENTAVKVTIAKWITPGGKNLNKDGLVPDIEVKLTEEDIAAEKDPQLDKALEEVVK